jgi:hypothetical protein
MQYIAPIDALDSILGTKIGISMFADQVFTPQ